MLTIEIQQIERQILGAQRRRDQALRISTRTSGRSSSRAEVQDFLRDKFTAHELYLYLQKETAALYRRMYELALDAARQAQHAFNLERGHTTRHFLPDCAWDDLHEGLLAGERLGLALRHMEKAYLDENVREYELTKHFSLRLHFPVAFLRLRTTGRCEIDIPEWMFDLDYPGHYMRRIRNVTVTIPCVTGPYTGVHCRLTLLGSTTRIDPRRSAPAHECCCPQPAATSAGTTKDSRWNTRRAPTTRGSSGSTARARRSPRRPATTIPACSSSTSTTSAICRSSTWARSAAGGSSCRRRTTTSTSTR